MPNTADSDGALWGATSEAPWTAVDITPFRATVTYFVFGSVMLLVSDFLLPSYVSGQLLTELQAVKGFAEVVVTAGFIFVLTKGSRYQLKTANTRLKRQQEELDVLHRVLRHNLRNKLNVVTASTSLLTDRMGDSPDSEFVVDYCERIRTAAEELLERAETARDIQRVSDSTATARFDAVALFEEVIDTVTGSHGSVRVTTSFPESAPIEAHVLFRKAAVELVHNAVEHNDGAAPEVSIQALDEPPRGQVVIEIRDNGPGIPQEVMDVVLSGNRDQVRHLNGLGLWFAYWCVDASGGEMEIETSDGGSCVRLRMPRAK